MSSRTPDHPIIQRFGEKLRALRKRRNLSIAALAEALGYSSHGYISELETGRKLPTVEFVVKAAQFLEVSTDLLLVDEIDLPPGHE